MRLIVTDDAGAAARMAHLLAGAPRVPESGSFMRVPYWATSDHVVCAAAEGCRPAAVATINPAGGRRGADPRTLLATAPLRRSARSRSAVRALERLAGKATALTIAVAHDPEGAAAAFTTYEAAARVAPRLSRGVRRTRAFALTSDGVAAALAGGEHLDEDAARADEARVDLDARAEALIARAVGPTWAHGPIGRLDGVGLVIADQLSREGTVSPAPGTLDAVLAAADGIGLEPQAVVDALRELWLAGRVSDPRTVAGRRRGAAGGSISTIGEAGRGGRGDATVEAVEQLLDAGDAVLGSGGAPRRARIQEGDRVTRPGRGALAAALARAGIGTPRSRLSLVGRLAGEGLLEPGSAAPSARGRVLLEALGAVAAPLMSVRAAVAVEGTIADVGAGRVTPRRVGEVAAEQMGDGLNALAANGPDLAALLDHALDAACLGECPDCGGRLELRRAARTGRRFAGCVRFPGCRARFPLPQHGVVRADPLGRRCDVCAAPLVRVRGGRGGPERAACVDPDCRADARAARAAAAVAARRGPFGR